MFSNVGLWSVRVRRGRLSVVTCSAKSGQCRDVFVDVWFVTERVRRSRICVGTYPAGLVYFLDLFGYVALESGLVQRGRLCVGTCSTRFSSCRYVFGEVWLVWDVYGEVGLLS